LAVNYGTGASYLAANDRYQEYAMEKLQPDWAE
jgi:hypothetical protein